VGIYGCPNCEGEGFIKEHLAMLNRKRFQRHRDNKRKTLVKVEVWIKPENKVKLVKFLEEDEM